MEALLINHFVIFFVVVDPIGVALLFYLMTLTETVRCRRQIALRAIALSTVILLVFFFTGDVMLKTLGVGAPAFRIAGGILFFLLAIDMVFARQSGLRSTTAREQAEAQGRNDISVFPLAFPLISGPGAMTTVLLMASESHSTLTTLGMVAIIVVVMGLALLALNLSHWLNKVLGETGSNVIGRLLGLILAALAVQYVIDGVKAVV
jgi:multiple antibiotic resistance protein